MASILPSRICKRGGFIRAKVCTNWPVQKAFQPTNHRPRTKESYVLTLSKLAFGIVLAAWQPSTGLPNPNMTPGAINPHVNQSNINTTICVRGWTRTVRPPEYYTERLKWSQIHAYGYEDRRLRNYEEDHLIPLELGGSPTSPQNLWPEPHHVPGGWGSRRKDRLENRLRELVCRGELPLNIARRAIATNWVAAYRRYMGWTP